MGKTAIMKNFSDESVTHHSSRKIDVYDEFSEKDDTLQANYASYEYLSPYSATFSREDFSAIMCKFIQDAIFIYPYPQYDWNWPQKNLQKNHLPNIW